MKYVSIDELNNFSFHDGELKNIDFVNETMKWQVSGINATVKNLQNSFEKDMCTEDAEMIFENVEIKKIVFCGYKTFDSNNNLIKEVDDRIASPDEYIEILSHTADDYCYIFSMDELSKIDNETYIVCFNLDSGVGNYYLTLSFSKSIVEWDEFYGIAWYEDEKWK